MVDARPWQSEADELDRAISEASGEVAPAGIPWRLDPALAETVRAVAEYHHGPAPSPEFAVRLAAQLGVAAVPASKQAGRRNAGPRMRFSMSARLHAPRVPLPVGRAVSFVSLAALLLVMLGGIWLTAVQLTPNRAAQPHEVSAKVTGGFPFSGPAGATVVVRRVTLAPGVNFTAIEQRLLFIVVESGNIDFRVFDSVPYQRLAPGEIGLTAALNGAFATGVASVRNSDAERPATILTVAIDQTRDPGANPAPPYQPAGVESTVIADGAVGMELTDRENVAVRLVTLDPGAAARSWPTDRPAWVLVERGQAGITLTGEHLPFPFASGIEQTAPTGTFLDLLPGVTVHARNAGSEPAVLLVLTIEAPPDATPEP